MLYLGSDEEITYGSVTMESRGGILSKLVAGDGSVVIIPPGAMMTAEVSREESRSMLKNAPGSDCVHNPGRAWSIAAGCTGTSTIACTHESKFPGLIPEVQSVLHN